MTTVYHPDWLEFAKVHTGLSGEQEFDIDKIVASKEVSMEEIVKINNDARGWIVFHRPDQYTINFAVLDMVGGVTFEEGRKVSGELARMVFWGEGRGGNLRECRHTYWGEDGDGYLHYPKGIVITTAFQRLAEYFNDMDWPDEGIIS